MADQGDDGGPPKKKFDIASWEEAYTYNPGGDNSHLNPVMKTLLATFHYTVDKPVTAIHDWIKAQQQKNKYPYYHRKFRRVPGIEDCDINDQVCIYEANEQFKRDHLVDQEILRLARQDWMRCCFEEGDSHYVNCRDLKQRYDSAQNGYDIKYGDLGVYGNAFKAFMKQKHRMIEERREAEKQES
ncbi:PREDICTED: NADH dehydrogenase [ubiquinone] 1 beta subcomplex subunit 10-like [Branchiostoma belcheri]|uniref:NADH dehydrogenase [ubiquinone] 1 beta subcomplex subunit 10 n=1 Tax=Branchiostoma belcheri TaxID=7741 RepID=A0A6P5AS33_BRABE|nr:PREDICTED: NADH dehydrogenase [ubiquinone] 1 beta subcomplex subunit 10-like [Branchiostoma belcheri]